MKQGGLEEVRVTREEEGQASLRFGNEKILEFRKDEGNILAIHKRKHEKPVAVDARELIRLLSRMSTG